MASVMINPSGIFVRILIYLQNRYIQWEMG